jgi:hypothetical protein
MRLLPATLFAFSGVMFLTSCSAAYAQPSLQVDRPVSNTLLPCGAA